MGAGRALPLSVAMDGEEVCRATLTVRNLGEAATRSKDARGQKPTVAWGVAIRLEPVRDGIVQGLAVLP
ncbi:hypothetical protein D3C87_485450 [compost metagenome]